MWNGIWKLTAMVGVIGVGLFAAYQAHVGMNAPVKSAQEESPPEEVAASVPDDTLKQIRDLPEFSLDQAAKRNDQLPVTIASRKSPKRKPVVEETEPLEEADSSAESPIRTVSDRRSSSAQSKVIPASQRGVVDFRDTDDSSEVAKSKESEPDQALSDDEPQPVRVKPKSRRFASADTPGFSSNGTPVGSDTPGFSFNGEDLKSETTDSTETATSEAEPATEGKEWGGDAAAGASNEEPASNEETAAEPAEETPADEPVAKEPEPAPAKEELKNEFDSELPPVTSNRAKKRAGAKSEDAPAPKSSAKKFEPKSEIQATSAAQSKDDDSSFGKEPQPFEAESEPVSLNESSTINTPPSLPDDTPARLPDPVEPAPERRRSTKTLPPVDTNGFDQLDDRAAKKKSPSTKRIDNRVIPVDDRDLVGDGIVGDASTKGVQQPRLVIEKVAQQQAVLDQPFVYSIVVKNTGNVDAHNVVIEDRIPKGTELQGTSPQAELTGKKLIWNHLVLKPNEEKRISIKVIPRQEGPVGSVARVYFATEVTAEIVVAAPQLEFTAKVPSEVRLGQRFDMVFTLKNVGKVEATNVIVRDVLPDELKNETGADIECPVGKLAPGESRELVLPVIAARPGRVTNRAYLEADAGIKKSHDNNIDVVGEVLVLTRSGQNRLYVERPAVFTNSIRNDGNQRAETVRISEVVPAGMEFESASDGGRYDANLKQVVWTIGPLAPGNDKQVSVKYVPRETGTHPSKITAQGTGGTSAAVDASVDVVGKPELVMETLSATGVVTVGDKITSKFQLNNTGTAAANNVQLRVRLPAELRLVSVKGTKFQQRDDLIVFDPISELAPKSRASYELVLEPVEEADAQIALEILADHLTKPGRRIETIQIAADALK